MLKTAIFKVLVFTFTAILIFNVFSVSAQKNSLPQDLSFISGHWLTDHDWGEMEEIWSAPKGDNMMGTYRCMKNGEVVFYEFFVIEHLQKDEKIHFRLRHFNPGNIAWEEKSDPLLMTLESLSKSQAIFQSIDGEIVLQYELRNPDELFVLLKHKRNSGWTQDEFEYKRKKD